ncbi:MAG: Na/Pi cotransporter family protein [Solobacterium sp.]|nr:Na/Pi cotransporter family protein [Solobacterium sp.]
MSIFDILTLFGGLALFLYGMRLMGDGLKEGSSGTLKRMMESVTNSTLKAVLLGTLVTAVIQSSTATIVITSGLVAAGIITFRQSLGIIIGANIGTTVTGQIIRLLDLNSSVGFLELFKPSSLAPIALIIGIVLLMTNRFKNSKTIGSVAIGFGILFTGLLNMTSAVNVLSENGVFDSLFTGLSDNPLLGYAAGAAVAFILQSSSATIGILQALSASGGLIFRAVYSVIVGVYLGDCVTTAIVCWIGAGTEARRVGIYNILYNFCKTVLVLSGIFITRKVGLLDGIWNTVVNSGIIANTNSVFNIASAVLTIPLVTVLEDITRKIVKDSPAAENKYRDRIEALNPKFFATPAIALKSCYDALMAMFTASRSNIEKACMLLQEYDANIAAEIDEEEENIDMLADLVTNYLAEMAATHTAENRPEIMNEYYKLVVEFERLGDYATNICEAAAALSRKGVKLSEMAISELGIMESLLKQVLDEAEKAFGSRDIEAARNIEPLEEVVDDMVEIIRQQHLHRLEVGLCTVTAGTCFVDVLHDMERISDTCSNVGLAIITRVQPELYDRVHEYIYNLHKGNDESFNEKYREARDRYVGLLSSVVLHEPVSEDEQKGSQ